MLCAYLAGLAWLGGERRMEAIGTIMDGYVAVPRATSRCEFGCCQPN